MPLDLRNHNGDFIARCKRVLASCVRDWDTYGKDYERWIRQLAGKAESAAFLADLIQHIADSSNPVLRRAKGVGPLENPGAYFFSRCGQYQRGRPRYIGDNRPLNQLGNI